MSRPKKSAVHIPEGGLRTLALLAAWFPLLLLSGCTTYGVVENEPRTEIDATDGYSLLSKMRRHGQDDNHIAILLTFSGGGTRAAALAYGVLQALRDTRISVDGRSVRLLDEIDLISSVSGGSFTAAYYGLYGERIFDDFERAFLKQDVEGELVRGFYNPLRWFDTRGRTDRAVAYYDRTLFHDATFGDMFGGDRPLIVINASDLGEGVRFSFLHKYFNLLCSDLSSFSVSRAVAASSAVPVLFNPVVVRNHPGCLTGTPPWLSAAQARLTGDAEMSSVADGMESYLDKDRRRYIHLVDGGITDNLGLRAIYEIVEMAGGAKAFQQTYDLRPPRRIVLIVVDASTDPEPAMDRSNEEPGLEETVNAMTDAQMHRYNAATIELLKRSQVRWARELSTPGAAVAHYFVRLGFRDLEPRRRAYFDRIPTSLSLQPSQVDRLIAVGRELLRSNPVFHRLLRDLATGPR